MTIIERQPIGTIYHLGQRHPKHTDAILVRIAEVQGQFRDSNTTLVYTTFDGQYRLPKPQTRPTHFLELFYTDESPCESPLVYPSDPSKPNSPLSTEFVARHDSAISSDAIAKTVAKELAAAIADALKSFTAA